jgi:hypothetical protein
MKKSISVTLVTLFVVFGFHAGLYGDDNCKTIAYQLACIDAGRVLSENDASISYYEYMLKSLDPKVVETKIQIADMTVKAQEILRDEYDIEITLIALMAYANQAMPDDANIKFRYAEIITFVIIAVQEND